MLNRFSRTQLLLGRDRMEMLRNARVAVFGIGGVGGYVVEALARSGVGRIDLIDNDVVSESNINRQIIATTDSIGRPKVEVAKERIRSIHPEAVVHAYQTFYMPDTAEQFDFTQYDYIVDAIDTVTGKIELIIQADKAKVPIISSMGAGNKMDPTAFRVTDIYKTKVCPLAKVMRRELKKRGIDKLKVVYSEEIPLTPLTKEDDTTELYENAPMSPIEEASEQGIQLLSRRQIPGSNAFVPSVAGLIIAGEIVKDLTNWIRE